MRIALVVGRAFDGFVRFDSILGPDDGPDYPLPLLSVPDDAVVEVGDWRGRYVRVTDVGERAVIMGEVRSNAGYAPVLVRDGIFRGYRGDEQYMGDLGMEILDEE